MFSFTQYIIKIKIVAVNKHDPSDTTKIKPQHTQVIISIIIIKITIRYSKIDPPICTQSSITFNIIGFVEQLLYI